MHAMLPLSCRVGSACLAACRLPAPISTCAAVVQTVNNDGTVTVPLLLGAPLPRAAWLTRAGFMYEVRVFYMQQNIRVSEEGSQVIAWLPAG